MKAISQRNIRRIKGDVHVQTLITLLSHKISGNISEILRRRCGIGATEWRVLAVLGVHGPSNGARVCDIVGLDKAAVSRSFSSLARKKLVRLEKNGGKSFKGVLTEKGLTLCEQIAGLSMAREDVLLAGISKLDRSKLFAMMNRVLSNIERLDSIDEAHFLAGVRRR